jgi:hypothetical protein
VPEVDLRGSSACWCGFPSVPKSDPAFAEVIGRHLDRDAVAGKHTNPVLFHLPEI